MVDRHRARRSCLAVPGSSAKMIDKARGLEVDQFFLDLEDAVAPLAKAEARDRVVEALEAGGWGGRTRSVRVNALDTAWTYQDVVSVVERAGAHVDTIILPKADAAEHVRWLDLMLTQIERACGLPAGAIGVEPQIESAAGLAAVDAIAAASPRVEALVYGPADFMASINMRSLAVGHQPPGYDVGDAYHYVLMRLLTTARAHGVQAVDGPYLQIKDADGLRRVGGRTAALGFDGKWVLHPEQVDVVNELFSPRQEDYDHAENILDAYAWYTSASGGARGAAMLGDEMIDEASRKMALVVAGKGRAAGLQRSDRWVPPEE
ncbi:HpcH/HpaI aldolase/citrate lyase family protein [Salinifilum ghardaiensis]